MSEEKLENLPSYAEAIKLSKEEYYRFANGVFNYSENCGSMFAKLNIKFEEWCSAMNCLESLDDCRVPPYPGMGFPTNVPLTIALPTTPTATLSYDQFMQTVGYNGTCYDKYYCNQRSVAPYLHFILGISCLVMCLVGILSTTLFLPAFNVVSNRAGVTLYLTAMAIVDCLYMILFTVIIVIQYIPYEFRDQLDMYARFTAYLIPYGLPTLHLMELISVWITVAILIDRFLYLKFGFHSKIICSRKVSAKIIGAILILLIIYTIPKYLEYHLIEYSSLGLMKVMHTDWGSKVSFQNLLNSLKVPIEMFLPYLTDAIFSVINSIKFYDLMYKRKLSEASTNKRKKMQMKNAIDCDYDGIMLSDMDQSEILKFPSLTINSSIPIINSSLKGAEDKENTMVIMSLILGFLLIALKIPKLILHALKSEEYVDLKSTKFFQPVNDFLDLAWVLAKPIIYLIVARHFRTALKSVFCCTEFNSETVVKVCPVVQITEMANEYLRLAPDFGSNNTTMDDKEHSKLLNDSDEGLVLNVKEQIQLDQVNG